MQQRPLPPPYNGICVACGEYRHLSQVYECNHLMMCRGCDTVNYACWECHAPRIERILCPVCSTEMVGRAALLQHLHSSACSMMLNPLARRKIACPSCRREFNAVTELAAHGLRGHLTWQQIVTAVRMAPIPGADLRARLLADILFQ